MCLYVCVLKNILLQAFAVKFIVTVDFTPIFIAKGCNIIFGHFTKFIGFVPSLNYMLQAGNIRI